MENNPTTPSLESSTLNLEKDLEDATDESMESFVIAEEEPSLESKSPTPPDLEKIEEPIQDVMTQSKYAQVSFFTKDCIMIFTCLLILQL